MSNIAIVLHLYYLDMWETIAGYLSNVQENFDLYVSLPDCCTDELIEHRILVEFPTATIVRVQNIGVDVMPFIMTYQEYALHRYKFCCKIHSKKSTRHRFGGRFAKDCYERLLGNELIVENHLNLLNRVADIGMIASHIVEYPYLYGENKSMVNSLCAAMQISEPNTTRFSAGNMFWVKGAALSYLRSVPWQDMDFEPGYAEDGTIAHAFERLFLHMTNVAGYHALSADEGLSIV
jgi:lipopolysaccharide biosynthesis protein